jgi:hypothetical protein
MGITVDEPAIAHFLGRLEQVQALQHVLTSLLRRHGPALEPEAKLAQTTNSILVDIHEDTLHGLEAQGWH